VAEVRAGRRAALGGGHGFPIARAGRRGAQRARRARHLRLRLQPRALAAPRGLRRAARRALRLAGSAGRGRAYSRRHPRLQRGRPHVHLARRRRPVTDAALPAAPARAGQRRDRHGRRRPGALPRRALRGGLGRPHARAHAADALPPALQPPQPGRTRLAAHGARASGGALPRARALDRRRRDPRRPRLRGAASRPDRLPRARDRRADGDAHGAEQDLEPGGPQARARGDPERRAARALRRGARGPRPRRRSPPTATAGRGSRRSSAISR